MTIKQRGILFLFAVTLVFLTGLRSAWAVDDFRKVPGEIKIDIFSPVDIAWANNQNSLNTGSGMFFEPTTPGTKMKYDIPAEAICIESQLNIHCWDPTKLDTSPEWQKQICAIFARPVKAFDHPYLLCGEPNVETF